MHIDSHDHPRTLRFAGALIMGAFVVVGYTSSASGQGKPTAVRPAIAKSTSSKVVTDTQPKTKVEVALWPVASPTPLPGAILPAKRIVAFYGNPLSKRMGILGEYEVDDMLARLDREVARWNKADPAHPVQPALHLIAVVAQGDPGKSGKWRM